jgi:adenosylcobinamide-GDP ribazoletransferase
MKDSRIGVMGAITLILILILKINIFKNANPGIIPASMFFSRFIGGYVISNSKYARSEGTGNFFKDYSFRENVFILLLSSFALFIFIDLKQYLFVTIISFILAKLLIRQFNNSFGGWTGDTVGASIEFSEVIILYVLSF